jgi:hypothetical protein
MPLKKRLTLILGGVLLVVVAAIARVEYLSQFSPEPPAQGNYAAQIYQHYLESFKASLLLACELIGETFGDFVGVVERNDKVIVALSTILIAIFTVVLGFATRGLRRSTNKLWDASEKQLRITQRSHIAVEPDGVKPLYPMPFAIGRIKIRNVGGVPAKKVRWFIHQAVIADAMRRDFPIEEREDGQSNVLPPGIAMNFSQSNTILSLGDSRDVRDGLCVYYVWGIVRYTDVFGGDRFTKFCHRYGADNYFDVTHGKYMGNAELRAEGAKYHQWGNDADEVP